MKIMIVTDLYLPHVGGILRHIQNVSKEFLADGHHLAFVIPSVSFKSQTRIDGNITIYSVESIPTPFYNDIHLALPFQNKRIFKAIQDFKPDIVHIHTNMTLAFMVLSEAKKLGIPVVGTNHFMSENILPKLPIPNFVKRKLDKFAWKTLIKLMNRFDILTTPSNWGANYLRGKGFKKQIKVISNGIDLSVYNSKNTISKNYLARKYKFPEIGKIILFVGRIDREKNIETILNSMTHIPDQLNINLVLTGKGTELPRLKKMAEVLNIDTRVFFTNFVDNKDLPSLYRSADLFVISSTAELQSIVTLEAMASGLPILAANAGALPELVQNNINGFLFEPHSSDKLAKEIIKITTDPVLRKRMAKASQRLTAEHDIKNVALRFEQLYKDLLGQTWQTGQK